MSKIKHFSLAANLLLAAVFTGCAGGTKFEVKDLNPVEKSVINEEDGTFVDHRDGKTYKYVVIDEKIDKKGKRKKQKKKQIWMAENLSYEAEGSRCYKDEPENCEKYGRLYDWSTAMGIDTSFNSQRFKGNFMIPGEVKKHKGVCPAGWHLPTTREFGILRGYAGGERSAGKILKAKHSWTVSEEFPKMGNGTDDFSFSALAGGFGIRVKDSFSYVYTIEDASFSMTSLAMNSSIYSSLNITGLIKLSRINEKELMNTEGLYGIWWNALDDGDNARTFHIINRTIAGKPFLDSPDYFLSEYNPKSLLASVRCIKDED